MSVRGLRYGTRLTIVYTAIFAVALLAFSGLAFGMVWWSLGASTAARLQTTAGAISPIPDVRHGRLVFDADDRRQFLAFLSENRVNGAAVANDGTILLSNVAAPPAAILAASGGKTTGGSIHSIAGNAYASQPIVDKGAVLGYVVTWISNSVNDEIARITLLSLLAASATIVIVAAIVGGIVVRRMLAPIVDLNAMISAIEASDLSERLAWDGPDDELGRLCITFDRLLDRLEAAFERERRFTANASHELRTPLAVMRAEIELTLTRERDEPAYRATLRRLQLETNRLEALVESLLLTARSDAGLATAAAYPLREVARSAVSRLVPIAAERDIALTVRPQRDAWAVVDPMLLESALVAVLDNALRYTPPGRAVVLTIDRSDTAAVLAIADGGDGFTPEALHRATQRFWRDDRSRSGTGMGLGLAIVATIVERHGGTIGLRNDGGGVVEIRLPAVEPQEWANSGAIGSTAASPA
jgi:signal transduction histidine kinase